MPPGIYSFKDISEFLSRDFQNGFETNLSIDVDYGPNHSIVIEKIKIRMKSKLNVESGNTAVRFGEKSSFNTILGCNPHLDFK